MALTDEFWSGVAVVAAPDVERAQSLGHGAYALLIFALPQLGAALLEASVALVSDRYPRQHVVGASLLATSAALAACALTASSGLLALGLTLAGAASGAACAAAQAELVETDPVSRERAMTRWVFCGGVGDVLTPLLVALTLAAGGTYRSAFVIAALVALGNAALLLLGHPLPDPAGLAADADELPPAEDAGTARACEPDDAAGAPSHSRGAEGAIRATSDPEDASEPLWLALRHGARNGRLWLWLLGAALCTFLDEVVVALAALHARDDLGASSAAAAACVASVSVGGVLGAAWTDRRLGSVSGERVLRVSAAGALTSLLAVVWAPSLVWLAVSLGLLGASAAPQYALLKARAYAASPGRPGVVNALSQAFVLVDVLGPLALGALADRAGVGVALGCLAVQPCGVMLIMLLSRYRRREEAA